METLKTSDFFYELPDELIAQTPAVPRDSARMLVYSKATDKVEHKIFRDILDYLTPNDVLVVNNTRVIDNNTLVALTLLIAESNPKEKNILIDLVMNFLVKDTL